MKLDHNVMIVFKNDEDKFLKIEITVLQLLEKTLDDLHEMLDNTEPCSSASCNNESQNFCDCGSVFDGYEIFEVLPI